MKIFRKNRLGNLPKHDLERLHARCGMLAPDDPLWPMLLAWVEANVKTETQALAPAGIGDEEAHRARGRVGMLLDLDAQLKQVWADSHK